MKTFAIKQATEADAQGLHEFMSRLVSERLPVLFERAAPPSVEEERDFIRRTGEPPGGVILLAVSGERVVGLLDFHREHRPQAAHGGSLGISVASDYRGQGVGRALLEALIAWAASHAVRRLELHVFETNETAIRLYERMGFREEGRRRKAVVVGGREIDVLVMGRLSGTDDRG